MSPLARSLLALAALLAAADATITKLPAQPGGKCAGFRMDITSRQVNPVAKEFKFQLKVNSDGQLHEIPDRCSSEFYGLITSQTVVVCNEFDHPKVPVWYPPKVFALGDEKLSPVFAACDPWAEASHECGLLTFHITQECIHMIAY